MINYSVQVSFIYTATIFLKNNLMQFRVDMLKVFYHTTYILLDFISFSFCLGSSLCFMSFCWTKEIKVSSTSPKNTRYKVQYLPYFLLSKYLFVSPEATCVIPVHCGFFSSTHNVLFHHSASSPEWLSWAIAMN